MTEQEKQHFDELILKAVQSGKKETSSLVAEIMHRMETHIEDAINKNVNGKIKRLDEKVDAYIASDNEWKKTAEPVIMMGKNLQGGGKVVLYLAGFVSAIGGAFLIIKNIWK